MKKTLGGNRLGSGNKMQVELHEFGRSTHDLSYIFRSTTSCGTLVPFMVKVALPGDTWDIDLGMEILTHPTIGPLFGSAKVQADVFQAPIRLYQGKLHNNALNIGLNMSAIKLPVIDLQAYPTEGPTLGLVPDIDNFQINPSCILAYLGIRGVGGVQTAGPQTRTFNAVPLLVYWDIFKNYYANKQEETAFVIHTAAENIVFTVTSIVINVTTLSQAPTIDVVPIHQTDALAINFSGAQPIPRQILITTSAGQFNLEQLGMNWTLQSAGVLVADYNFAQYGNIIANNWDYTTSIVAGPPQLAQFTLTNLDVARDYLLANLTSPVALKVNNMNLDPFNMLLQTGEVNSMQYTQEGLAVKTYQSDVNNNWINTEWIDGPSGITAVTAIDTSGGSFTLDTLNLSKKVYLMMNRIAVSGGSYYNWIESVYDHVAFQQCETPIYYGSLIKELVFQEVVSNSESNGDGGTQPLGTLAGKGRLNNKHKGGSMTIKVNEPSYIMGIFSITPRIDYSQGNNWDTHLLTLDDFHKPNLDEIGFQELITEQMAWWDTNWDDANSVWVQKSAGKQPAWVNYMTSTNQCYGNFAIKNNQMFMTFNRQYQYQQGDYQIEDMTTYIDPVKFNNIFAQTSLDAQNYWVQIAIKATVRRVMSGRIMPNL